MQLRWTPATSAAFSAADRGWLLKKLASKLTSDGDLIVASNLTRNQGRNRVDAEAKLAALVIAALVRPKKRRATKPSRAARERRVDEKKARGLIKKEATGDGRLIGGATGARPRVDWRCLAAAGRQAQLGLRAEHPDKRRLLPASGEVLGARAP